MIKKIALVFLFFTFLQSQSQEIKNYSWDEKPVFKTIPDEYKDQPAVVLFDKRWVHTRVGAYAFANFVMNHFAIKINKAEEINNYNKIKAEDNGYVRDLRDFHARIIKPNGEIKVLPKDKIIEVSSDKTKSIVFEGVEAGDILEYYFILKQNPLSYSIEIFQKEIPVLEAEFSHTSEGVNIETYTSQEFKEENSYGRTISKASNIPPFKEEESATNFKNIVKLIYVVSVSSSNANSWSTFLPFYFKKPSFQFFKKNQAREFIEKLNIESLSTDEKMLKIDEYIKTNFDFIGKGETAKKIKDLNDGQLKLKASDIFDLYCFTLKEFKIPYQVVIGMSRFIGNVGDNEFLEALSHEFMLYIPETQKFISPYEKYLPYGFPMYEVQGSNAVTYEPGNYDLPVSNLVFPIAPANYTVFNSQSLVSISDDLITVSIDKTYSNSGYEGQFNRGAFKYLKENKEEKDILDFLESSIFGKDVGIKIKSYTLENQEFKNNYSNIPSVVKVKAEAKERLTENAGNLVLVNLGKIIGFQNNLYQETERKFDIDLTYAKTFIHKITFDIPLGYEVESFKDFILEAKMTGDEAKICSFKSDAKVIGNQLIIEVFEVYNAINYPKDKYSEYRKVINTAADFSKASVVLKPKK